MKKELDELLCKRYPKIFRDRYSPMTVTAMCWGFDIGDGWFNIIECAVVCNGTSMVAAKIVPAHLDITVLSKGL
jgi:hypothetical protein